MSERLSEQREAEIRMLAAHSDLTHFELELLAELDIVRSEKDELAKAIKAVNEERPDALIVYVVRRAMNDSGMPTEHNGEPLSMATRFDMFIHWVTRSFKQCQPFLGLIEAAEEQNAPNFMTAQIDHKGKSWECTVRRPEGKTPTIVLGELREALRKTKAAFVECYAAVARLSSSPMSTADHDLIGREDVIELCAKARRKIDAAQALLGPEIP